MITFRRLGRLGRFGNQLFQYAGARLYAQTHGYEWGFPMWDGERIFKIPHRRPRMRSLLSPTIQLSDMTSTGWSERFLSPLGLWQRDSLSHLYGHPRDNLNLYGYLQDDASIRKLREHTDEVRSWFRFRNDIDERCRRATDTYRPWLAVHIRRGDMVKRGAATNAEDALNHASRLRGERNLFVATDDPVLRGRVSGDAITPENPLPELPGYVFDFWMLANANILIGSGSTFAWWAAFLGGMEYWSPPLNRTWASGYSPVIERQNV